ncbi:MAG: MBL fold metallo-hydrolase, partial [Proteobacteria bacterium]|nr:MBL fold metallo-hydrolase [Pseudomonadota bacterium]
VNTDHHFDHVMGNAFLSPNIIYHNAAAESLEYLRNKELLRKIINGVFPDQMEELEPELDELEIPSAHISFDNRLFLDMGDATIDLEFVGGHSPGTILIHCPEERAVFTGDNVEGLFPYFGQADFKSWKAALKKMLSMEIDLVVPGHGPVGGMEMIETYDAFFTDLENEVRDFDASGIAVEQMADKSRTIHTFPIEPAMAPWIKVQYRDAAKAVLSAFK